MKSRHVADKRRLAVEVWYTGEHMTKLLAEALKVLRDLPQEEQEKAARAIIDYGAREDKLQLTDEQVVEIERRMANPERKFISLAELRKRLHRYGV
jgi:hypothetical protein